MCDIAPAFCAIAQPQRKLPDALRNIAQRLVDLAPNVCDVAST
jgi:hypothetical protein